MEQHRQWQAVSLQSREAPQIISLLNETPSPRLDTPTDIVPPIGEIPPGTLPPEDIVPPIGEVPTGSPAPQPTGTQPQPPRPRPTGTEPPRPQPPRPQPPRPEPPRPQPPRPEPPRPEPPRPQPPRPQPPRPEPPQPPNIIIRPPGITVPPLGQLPSLGIQPPPGQAFGRGRCLGPASLSSTPLLQGFINQELNIRQAFLTLAHRTNIWRTTISNFASDNLTQARRLATANRYITGSTYWPSSITDLSSGSGARFETELRHLLSLTQDLENDYRIASGQVTDRCLGALYSLLADQKALQIGEINTILSYY